MQRTREGRIAEVPSPVLCIPWLNVAAAGRSRRYEWGPISSYLWLAAGLWKVFSGRRKSRGLSQTGAWLSVSVCWLGAKEFLLCPGGQPVAVTGHPLGRGNAIAGQTNP
jgi:hypothetical protein